MNDAIIAHYERHAHDFDRDRNGGPGGALIEQGWLTRFILPLAKGAAMLDLGCGGSEPVDRFLIDRGFKLTGVDGAPTLIEFVRTRFPRHEWLIGDMRRITIVRQFDAILAWSSLFHLSPPDQEAMIDRIGRWLKPGGRLLFNSGPAHGVAMGEYRGDPLYHASLDPAEYRAAFTRNGLIEVAYVPDDRHCGGMSVWLARKA